MKQSSWWTCWTLGFLITAGNFCWGEEAAPRERAVGTRPGTPGTPTAGSLGRPERASGLIQSIYFDQAVQLYNAGQLEAAQALFENALKTNPQDVAALCWLGCILLQQNRIDEAVKALEQAIFLNPKYALAHNNLAFACLEKKLPEAALQHYQKALEYDPQYADAYYNLANLYRGQKKFREAIQNYQKAIQLVEGRLKKLDRPSRSPGRPDPQELSRQKELLQQQLGEYFNNLGQTYHLLSEERKAQGSPRPAQQALSKALEAYIRATQLAPHRTLFFINLGLIQRQMGPDHLAEAIQALERALTLYPQDRLMAKEAEGISLIDLYLQLGMAYADGGRFQEAEQAFLKVQALQPQKPWGYSHLGKLYTRQKDFERAEEAYLQALELQPNDPALLHNLGCVYFQMQRWDDAIAQFQKALEGQPEETLTHTNLALAYQRKGLLDQARREWQWVVAKEPENVPGRVALADLYFRQQAYNEAEAHYRQAIELGAQDPEIFNNVGVIYLERNEVGLAEASFKRALKLNDRNPRAYNNLGVCYEHRSSKEKALQMYQKALAIDPGYEDAKSNRDRLNASWPIPPAYNKP